MAPDVDAMLMTRPPPFCRIMSFVAARVMRNAPRRLTSMTWSQSSSFMRTRRPSRMTPALLTRMSTRPNRCLAASTRRSASSRLAASAATPRTAPPCASSSFAERWSRSASRPETTTAAPSSASNAAIARPMPRPPPVTIATRPSRAPFVIGSPRLRLSPARPRSRARLDRRERLLEPRRVFDREPPGAVDGALEEPGQHAPWPDLDEGRGALGRDAPHAVGPADRARHLPEEEGLDLRRGASHARVGVAHDGDRGIGDRDRAELAREPLGGRRHERAVERRAHREHDALLPTPGGGEREGALHRGAVPRDDDLL